MTRKFIIIILLIGLAGIYISCQGNIFGWLYPEEGEDVDSDDIEDYIEAGDAQLRMGNAKNAWEIFDKAFKKWSKSGIARQRATRAYILYKGNVDLIMLASKFSSGTEEGLLGSISTDLITLMSKIIYYLDNVAKGKCDSSVKSTDFEVNMNLMLAYFIRGILGAGDKPNQDGNYFSDGDLLMFKDGTLTYNTDFIDIDGLQTSLQGDIDSVISSLPPAGSGAVPKASISNMLKSAHDLVEILLTVYSIIGESFSDLNNANFALNNGLAGLSKSETMDDIKRNAELRYNEIKGYLDGAYSDTVNLNNDHKKIVGEDMVGYTGDSEWYNSFSTSSWISHTPPVGAPANLYRDLWDHSGDYDMNPLSNPANWTNDLNYILSVSECIMLIFQHVEESNLIKNIMGN